MSRAVGVQVHETDGITQIACERPPSVMPVSEPFSRSLQEKAMKSQRLAGYGGGIPRVPRGTSPVPILAICQRSRTRQSSCPPSTAPSDGGGSGKSSSRAVPLSFGMTVMALMGGPLLVIESGASGARCTLSRSSEKLSGPATGRGRAPGAAAPVSACGPAARWRPPPRGARGRAAPPRSCRWR